MSKIDEIMKEESQKPSQLEELLKLPRFAAETLRKIAVSGLAIFVALLALYTSSFGQPNYLFYRSLILSVILIIAFIQYPMIKRAGRKIMAVTRIIDLFLILAVVAIQTYVLVDFNQFAFRQGSPTMTDTVLGAIYILLVLEATRRTVGYIMFFLAAFFIGQLLISDKLFWIFYGPPMKLSGVVDFVWMRDEGLYSTPIMSVFTYVIPFLIFASFLVRSGAGKFFIELAVSVTGRLVGGPAKAAIVSSTMMGTISGSAVGNVVGTGAFTIPLMKRTGYEPKFAGAVEAVASTGGQIMPPVMGAAAFILAQNLQMPYGELIMYAAIPALLYYVALYFSVHLEAKRAGLRSLKKGEVPRTLPILLNRGYLLIPLFVIIGILLSGFSTIKAALYATLCLIPLTFFRKETRLSPVKFLSALEDAIRDLVPIAVACAAAGLIIAGVNISGVGLQFAYMITDISQGILWLTLVLVMITAVILGFGLPTTAVYVTVAVLMAPALQEMGISPLQAHMFAFYYGVIAAITPPVALASFAAASIAKTDPMKTGYTAFRIGLAGFIIPFMFVYGPELLLQGEPLDVALAFVSACIGLYMMSASTIGYVWHHRIGYLERILFFVASLLMVYPGLISDLIGLAMAVALVVAGAMIRKQPLWRSKGADSR